NSTTINSDSLNRIIKDSIEEIFLDSMSKVSFEEILEKCSYEKLSLNKSKDTTIRLFIFSGAVDLGAEIFTLKNKDKKLSYSYDACVIKHENDSRKFEKTFTHTNKLTGKSFEVGYIKILSGLVKESDILHKKIENLDLCSLQNVKPKERDVIILHSETYYLEIASEKGYCIISRDEEQEIEEEFSKFTYELQKIARKSYKNY
ncbi:MAG: hypothetical protein GY823_00830, partial [Flavobacteriaceae bacterium]|nr:hypothetical protein [Flavobacteriaceae bacterium]